MSTDEYTPTDEDMRKRHRWAWEQCPINRHALDEADAQWTRWLAAHDARVKRDAAREAVLRLRDHLAGSRGYDLIGPEGLDHYIRREHPDDHHRH